VKFNLSHTKILNNQNIVIATLAISKIVLLSLQHIAQSFQQLVLLFKTIVQCFFNSTIIKNNSITPSNKIIFLFIHFTNRLKLSTFYNMFYVKYKMVCTKLYKVYTIVVNNTKMLLKLSIIYSKNSAIYSYNTAIDFHK
jgi:hypothetical protein